jgi:hypothetical protein
MKKIIVIAVLVAALTCTLVGGTVFAAGKPAPPSKPNVIIESDSGAVAPGENSTFSYPEFSGVRHVSVTIFPYNLGPTTDEIIVRAVNRNGFENATINLPVLSLSVAPNGGSSQTVEFNAIRSWSIVTGNSTGVGYCYTVTYPAP